MQEDPGSIPGSGRSPGEGIGYPLQYSWASLVAQTVKNPPATQEPGVQSLGWEDPIEEEICIFPFYCFPLFLCTDHLGRLSCLSLLFFGTLHSDEYFFPFCLCLSLLFFSLLFVRPPQTTVLPFCISFSWGWFDHCLLYNVTNLCP